MLGDWREAVKDRDKLLLLTRYWLLILRDYFWHQAKALTGQKCEIPVYLAGLQAFSQDDLWSLWERGLNLEAGLLGHRDPVLLIEEWLIPVLANF